MNFRFYVFLKESDAVEQMVSLTRAGFQPIMSKTDKKPIIMFPSIAKSGAIINADTSVAETYWVVQAKK